MRFFWRERDETWVFFIQETMVTGKRLCTLYSRCIYKNMNTTQIQTGRSRLVFTALRHQFSLRSALASFSYIFERAVCRLIVDCFSKGILKRSNGNWTLIHELKSQFSMRKSQNFDRRNRWSMIIVEIIRYCVIQVRVDCIGGS